jgi:hypothetical protein
MKIIPLRLITQILLLLCLFCKQQGFAQSLRVSENKRYLVKADGKPFFYLGDTAWELFHRLNREEALKYLKNRADKGFTVIQAVVLAELNGLHDPNPYGHLPLINEDPTRPNEDYFAHVDYIIDKADELGLYIGLLPTWGDKIFKNTWGVGPEIFTGENARIYGEYIGKRYKNRDNIIWILGGDRNPRNGGDVAIWRSMAEGIIAGAGEGDPDKVLMTFHPQPKDKGGSSTWFHQDAWLDFNMFQTGHCKDQPTYDKITHDYNLVSTKPTMDGEPIYEDHPVCFNAKENGTSTAADVRKIAYWDLFAGAHGHTYGCHDIWQMWQPGRQPLNGPHHAWYDALDLPGATQMTYVRNLMTSRPMLERIPDQSIITDALAGPNHIRATRGEGYLFVYSATGQPFTVQMGKIAGKEVKSYWYDPRTGETTIAGKFMNTGTRLFTPPTKGQGNDWVLILDDARKKFKEPGK